MNDSKCGGFVEPRCGLIQNAGFFGPVVMIRMEMGQKISSTMGT